MSYSLKMQYTIHWVQIFKTLIMDLQMKYKKIHISIMTFVTIKWIIYNIIKFYQPIYMVSHPREVISKSSAM